MASKFGPPKRNPLANPAAKRMTAQEAEDTLVAPPAEDTEEVTNDSDNTEDEAQNTQDIIDEVFGADNNTDDDTDDDTDEEGDDEIEDKPTKPAKVVAAKKQGSNLSPEQQKYWDDIGKLGQDQGKGVSSLISLAEKIVHIGASATFESSQLKDIYLHFRKNSNSAAGKNAEVGTEDHTVVSNTSKLRTFYKVGEKHGVAGWSKMLKVARDIHVSILRSKDERKLLRSKQLVPTYEALVKVASTQMKQEADAKGVKQPIYPQLLDEAQIRDVFIDQNKQEAEPTVTDVIKAAAKAIERVIRGKVNPDTGAETREAFEAPKNMDEDDESVGYALVSSLSWILDAGERFETGFKANREKEMAEAKAAAEERHKKHEERMAKEEAERQAKKAKREAEAKAKAAEKAMAKEDAA